MCMNLIHFSFEKDKDYGIGYKSYLREKHGKMRIIGAIKSVYFDNNPIPRKKWHKSSTGDISTNSLNRYTAGFHIFLSQSDAYDYADSDDDDKYENVIVRVRFRGVVAFGTNDTNVGDGPCVIAREMYLDEVVEVV